MAGKSASEPEATAKAPLAPWVNRIVGHGTEDPRALLPHPLNPRLHALAQKKALAAAIHRIGYLVSVTKNVRTGRLVNGHLRVELAILEGQAEVPVEYVDLSPEEEVEALAYIDPITAMATQYDPGRLDALLRQVHVEAPELQQLLSDLAKDARLYRQEYAHMSGEDMEDEGEDRGDGEAPASTLYPLAIVLSAEEHQLWLDAKRNLGARSDRELLLMLLPEGGSGL